VSFTLTQVFIYTK